MEMDRLKVVVTLAFAGLLAGCAEPDEYGMSRKDAYDKLMTAKIESSETGPFHRLVTTIDGNGGSEVTYDASGSMAHHACTMKLAELAADKTKVAVICQGGGAGDGAAAGMVHHMIRNRVIELVDATLKGRPFDPQLAEGSTAFRWPNDGVDGSIGTAAKDALKMEADIKREIAESETQAREIEPVADYVDPASGSDPSFE